MCINIKLVSELVSWQSLLQGDPHIVDIFPHQRKKTHQPTEKMLQNVNLAVLISSFLNIEVGDYAVKNNITA